MKKCLPDRAREYFDILSRQYPMVKNWDRYGDKDWEKIVIFLAKKNLEPGIRNMDCICDCIDDNLWQEIANIGAEYGYDNLVSLAYENSNINLGDVSVIARQNDHREIARVIDGQYYIIDNKFSSDYDDFPANFGPTGDPNEDKAEWIFDYRMQDYKEDMLPEEPNIFNDEDDSYYIPVQDYVPPDEFDDDEDEDLIPHQEEIDIIYE